MSEPPPDPQSGRPGPGSGDFDPKKHYWDGKEWWTADRELWWDGVRWQPSSATHVPGVRGTTPLFTLPSRAPRNPSLHFWAAFTFWFLGNVLYEVLTISALLSSPSSSGSGLLLALAWLPANVVGIPLLTLVSARAALGSLAAFACAFANTVVEGIVNGPADFLVPSTPMNGQYIGAWFVLLVIGAVMTARAYLARDESRPA